MAFKHRSLLKMAQRAVWMNGKLPDWCCECRSGRAETDVSEQRTDDLGSTVGIELFSTGSLAREHKASDREEVTTWLQQFGEDT
jgi:hypothetical protein